MFEFAKSSVFDVCKGCSVDCHKCWSKWSYELEDLFACKWRMRVVEVW